MELSTTTRILFSKPINITHKNDLVKEIIKSCNINGVRSDPSHEGGVNLPLTPIWYTLNLQNKQYLIYHDSRQFRFISKDDNIIGMRCKDEINYLTDDEINSIKNSVELYITQNSF